VSGQLGGVALALGAAAGWGAADFLGGLRARSVPVLAVLIWTMWAGVIPLAAGALLLHAPLSWAGVAWGTGGGLAGLLGLMLFYSALAGGAMSLVAPLGAMGGALPFAVAVALGHIPTPPEVVGSAIALAGAVMVASAPRGAPLRPHVALTRRVRWQAIGGAVAIGVMLTLAQQAARAPGSSGLCASLSSRTAGATLALLVGCAVRRGRLALPRRLWIPVFVTGLFDAGATAAFTAASRLANEGVVGTLGSLYPVATVGLAVGCLGERFQSRQAVGALLTFAGVAAIAAA
jgi:drug/metabolite transporter (DMT)-like permease